MFSFESDMWSNDYDQYFINIFFMLIQCFLNLLSVKLLRVQLKSSDKYSYCIVQKIKTMSLWAFNIYSAVQKILWQNGNQSFITDIYENLLAQIMSQHNPVYISYLLFSLIHSSNILLSLYWYSKLHPSIKVPQPNFWFFSFIPSLLTFLAQLNILNLLIVAQIVNLAVT